MSVELHKEWAGETHLVGRIHPAGRGQAVSFEYVADWLGRAGAFAIDPTSLPLRPGAHHSSTLFGAMHDRSCKGQVATLVETMMADGQLSGSAGELPAEQSEAQA